MSIRARASGRDLHGLDAGVGQDRVKRGGELPGTVPDQEPEFRGAVTEVAATLDRVRLKREEVLNGLIHEYKRAA
jgi:hypothetical protein